MTAATLEPTRAFPPRGTNIEHNKPLPKIHPRGQLEFAPKLLSWVLTSSKFLISGCLLVFNTLAIFSEICKGGARSSSHWPCQFNLKSTIFQKYPTTQVFGRIWAQLSSSSWLNTLQILWYFAKSFRLLKKTPRVCSPCGGLTTT
jgi:hypothetical protein